MNCQIHVKRTFSAKVEFENQNQAGSEWWIFFHQKKELWRDLIFFYKMIEIIIYYKINMWKNYLHSKKIQRNFSQESSKSKEIWFIWIFLVKFLIKSLQENFLSNFLINNNFFFLKQYMKYKDPLMSCKFLSENFIKPKFWSLQQVSVISRSNFAILLDHSFSLIKVFI